MRAAAGKVLLPILPLPLAIAAGQLAYVYGGGQTACFQSLDLDTPGLICAPVLQLFALVIILIPVHLFVTLSLLWLLVSKRTPRGLTPRTASRWSCWIGAAVLLLALVLGAVDRSSETPSFVLPVGVEFLAAGAVVLATVPLLIPSAAEPAVAGDVGPGISATEDPAQPRTPEASS